MTTLILFDIDGTLLKTRNAGRQAFCRALEKTFQLDDDIAYIHFGGNTDLLVLEEILKRNGRQADQAEVTRFFRCMADELDAGLSPDEVDLLPGVENLLDTLSSRHGILTGLVTGNTGDCARIKLKQHGLDRHFSFGGYGDDHGDRCIMAELAVERAQQHLPNDHSLGPCFLIGDTPSDVRAAKHIGATSIAVATGAHPVEELQALGADWVLEHLEDTAGVMAILEGTGTSS